jgi:hypothetical protein
MATGLNPPRVIDHVLVGDGPEGLAVLNRTEGVRGRYTRSSPADVEA